MPASNPKILVIIPMYNCEAQISRVLGRFTKDIIDFIDTILVIDNRSQDRSIEKASAALAAIKDVNGFVIRNCENYGLGGSQKVGFNFAITNRFDYAVILHGDDQGDVCDLLPPLHANTHTQLDAVLGARFMRGSELTGYPFVRTYGNIAFNILFYFGLGKYVPDLGAGINLYSTKILNDRFFIKFPDNLTFNYAMTMAHVRLQHKVMFFPIHWREDDQISNVKLVSQCWRVLRMLLSFTLNKDKFLQAEHRESPRQDYPYEVMYSHNAVLPENAIY